MNKQIYLERLAKLIAIPSKRDIATSSSEAPFGKAINDCFLQMAEFAKEDGLHFEIVKNRTLEITTRGNATSNDIAVLAHLDVVPEGNLASWKTNPFQLVVDGDYMYGRGVSDDKGPALLVYQAIVQLIKDNNDNNRNIRMILGGAEETSWECIESYFEVKPHPKIAFTPDSKFPLVNGEKGIATCEITFKDIILDAIEEFDVNNAINVVPDYAAVTIKGVKYEFKGISAHSSIIEKSENAVDKMLKELSENAEKYGIKQDVEKFQLIIDHFTNDPYLEKINCNIEHPKLGKSTSNLAYVKYDKEAKTLIFGISYRLSYGLSVAKLFKAINEKIEGKASLVVGEANLEPFYYSENEPFIKHLLNAYNEATKEEAKPLCGGGTSYAKSTKNCVAFGPNFGDFDTKAHEPNEVAKISDYEKAYNIYYTALKNLCQKG